MKSNYTKKLSNQYSFSHADNIVKRTRISPDKFMQETYKESLNKCKSDNEYRRQNNREPKPCLGFRQYRKQVLSSHSIIGIKQVLQGKKESKYPIPLPFLEYDLCGRPIGHEGRHTMTALKSLGEKKVPVTIVKRKFQYNWEKPC